MTYRPFCLPFIALLLYAFQCFAFDGHDGFEKKHTQSSEVPSEIPSEVPSWYESYLSTPAAGTTINLPDRTLVFENTFPSELFWKLGAGVTASMTYVAIPYLYAAAASSIANKIPGHAHWLRTSVSVLTYTMATAAVISNALVFGPAIARHTDAIISSEASRRRCGKRRGVMPVYQGAPWMARNLLMKIRFGEGMPATLVIDRLSGQGHAAIDNLDDLNKERLDQSLTQSEGMEIAHWQHLEAAMSFNHTDRVEVSIQTRDGNPVIAIRSQSENEHVQNILPLKSGAPWDLDVLAYFCPEYGSEQVRSVFHPEVIETLSGVIAPGHFQQPPETNSCFFDDAVAKITSESNIAAVVDLGQGGQLVYSDQGSLLTPSVGFMVLTDHSLDETELLAQAESPVFSQGMAVLRSRQITVPEYMVNSAMMYTKLLLDAWSLNQMGKLLHHLVYSSYAGTGENINPAPIMKTAIPSEPGETTPAASGLELSHNSPGISAERFPQSLRSLQDAIRYQLFEADNGFSRSQLAQRLYEQKYGLLSMLGTSYLHDRDKGKDKGKGSDIKPAPAAEKKRTPKPETDKKENSEAAKKQKATTKLAAKSAKSFANSRKPATPGGVLKRFGLKPKSEQPPALPPKPKSGNKYTAKKGKPPALPAQVIREFPVVGEVPIQKAGEQKVAPREGVVQYIRTMLSGAPETPIMLGGSRLTKEDRNRNGVIVSVGGVEIEVRFNRVYAEIDHKPPDGRNMLSPDSDQAAALLIVTSGRGLDKLKRLIEAEKIDLNYKYSNQYTLLHRAIEQKWEKIIKYLLTFEHLNLCQRDHNDFSSLDLLIWTVPEGKHREYFVKIPKDNLQTAFEQTFKHGVQGILPATTKKWESAVIAAIDCDFDFSNMETAKGNLIFHNTVRDDSIKVINAWQETARGQEFIKNNLDRPDNHGNYPVTIAAHFGLKKMWIKLDSLGAKYQPATGSNKLPHEAAYFCTHDELAQFMKETHERRQEIEVGEPTTEEERRFKKQYDVVHSHRETTAGMGGRDSVEAGNKEALTGAEAAVKSKGILGKLKELSSSRKKPVTILVELEEKEVATKTEPAQSSVGWFGGWFSESSQTASGATGVGDPGKAALEGKMAGKETALTDPEDTVRSKSETNVHKRFFPKKKQVTVSAEFHGEEVVTKTEPDQTPKSYFGWLWGPTTASDAEAVSGPDKGAKKAPAD